MPTPSRSFLGNRAKFYDTVAQQKLNSIIQKQILAISARIVVKNQQNLVCPRLQGCNVKQLRCYNTTMAESNPSLFSNLALSRRNDKCAVSQEPLNYHKNNITRDFTRLNGIRTHIFILKDLILRRVQFKDESSGDLGNEKRFL